jgi:hypothetical protein
VESTGWPKQICCVSATSAFLMIVFYRIALLFGQVLRQQSRRGMGADGFACYPARCRCGYGVGGIVKPTFQVRADCASTRLASIGAVISRRLPKSSGAEKPDFELAWHTLSRLAPAATSPASAATAATPASTTGSPSASAAARASAPTTAPVGHLYTSLQCCVVLFVEDVEGRQVDVGNFFLTEEEFVMRCGILRWHIHCRSSRRCGCSARHRQRYAGDSQDGCGSLPTSSP